MLNKIMRFIISLILIESFGSVYAGSSTDDDEPAEITRTTSIEYTGSASPLDEGEEWESQHMESLSGESLQRLFENRIPAIVVKNFFPEHHCRSLVKEIEEEGYEYYENVEPPIGRIGITQFEGSQKEKQVYFSRSSQAYKKQHRIFRAAGVDPVARVKGVVEAMLSHAIAVAHEPGHGDYFCGLMRQINAARLHFDYGPYDGPDWAIGAVTNQLTWNIFLRAAEVGGETVVYNRFWKPDIYAEYQEGPTSYPFASECVSGIGSCRIGAATGDLVLFNTRNFHEVLPSEPRGARITVSSFIGQLSNREVIMWS